MLEELSYSLTPHKYSAKTLLLASGSGDNTIKIWDMESGMFFFWD